MKKIRAVLIDMDGTCLSKSQVAISMRNMKAIQDAIKAGVHIIPCTGRVFTMMPPQLLTQEGIRYYVTSHGARVYDKETGESLYTDLIPAEEGAKICEIIEGHRIYNEVAAEAKIYFEKDVSDNFDMATIPPHHAWFIQDHWFESVEKPSEYFREHNIGIEKMNIYRIPVELQQEIYDAITATGYVSHTRPGAGPNLEFLHCTLDKLKAVDVVLEKLGLTYEDCMAIGDSVSDYKILQKCGLGVAMGNAPDDIKAAANVVTGLNTEDGFAEAFEKYVL